MKMRVGCAEDGHCADERLTDEEMSRVLQCADHFNRLGSKERQYAMGLIAKIYTRRPS